MKWIVLAGGGSQKQERPVGKMRKRRVRRRVRLSKMVSRILLCMGLCGLVLGFLIGSMWLSGGNRKFLLIAVIYIVGSVIMLGVRRIMMFLQDLQQQRQVVPDVAVVDKKKE